MTLPIETHGTALTALQATSLFKAMSDKEAYDLFAASQVIELDKGAVLHLLNDEADWFYLVLSGWVKIFLETLDGDEAVMELVGSGQFFGELAGLEGCTYNSNASIAEKTTLIRLPSSLLAKAIKNNHTLALAMLKSMSNKRLEQMREVEGLKLQKADQRIGCFILRQCQGKSSGTHNFTLPYCKSLIATQLGMKGETFSRALNKLRSALGIVITGNDVVADIDKLAELVCVGCSKEYPCKDLLH